MDKAQELAEQAWTAYRRGQISADHTAKDVFCEVVLGLLTTASAAPQPPSASGDDNAAFKIAFLAAHTYPEGADQNTFRKGWQAGVMYARAALAPSPGIDAAEQEPERERLVSHSTLVSKPGSKLEVRELHLTEAGMRAITSTATSIPGVAAPPAAQPSAEYDPAFPFYELRFIMRVLDHAGSAPKEDWQTAYGMARDIFVRWSKNRQAAEPHPPSRACMCDACKPSFENGADDPAQRYDIVRQVPGPSAEWLAEAERLVSEHTRSIGSMLGCLAYGSPGFAQAKRKCNAAHAALLAHLRTKPSTEPWCDTMDSPKSKCGCPDCGPSLIDLGPGLRNTPGKP